MSLLEAVEQAGTTGQSVESSVATPATTVVHGPIEESAGTVVGPYKLLERIGEGGFGVVYMAEQQAPVRRRVALKIIKPGMDTRQVIARFEAERQALAMMDHPNIARALDAGATSSGRPYFVMELVRGVPITDYCDRQQLASNERLEFFVLICQAVQHAHQKGIIHRDIKPSNILVTVNDGIPMPKVIDFGVAKAINQRLTDRTLFTHFAEMVGTPLYMSPEQAEMTSLDVDTRSDIYSLGVLLYELLTGTTPFDQQRLNQLSFDEIRRIIREEDPAKPSTRLSTLGQKRADDRRPPRERSHPAAASRARRSRLDRDEGARQGSNPPLRHGQHVRDRRSPLSATSADRGPSAVGFLPLSKICAKASRRVHDGLTGSCRAPRGHRSERGPGYSGDEGRADCNAIAGNRNSERWSRPKTRSAQNPRSVASPKPRRPRRRRIFAKRVKRWTSTSQL